MISRMSRDLFESIVAYELHIIINGSLFYLSSKTLLYPPSFSTKDHGYFSN